MKAMKWLLSVAVAAAIVVPLQSAQAGSGGNDGGGRPAESYRVHYRGDGYYGGYRGYHRHHRHYHRHHRYHRPYGYYRGHRHDYRGYSYYGRPWGGYSGPRVVAPLLPPPPPPW